MLTAGPVPLIPETRLLRELPSPKNWRRIALQAGLGLLLALAVGAAVLVVIDPPYSAGDAIGYQLGLIGGLIMLTMLLYPLRKRLHVFEQTGSMTAWFNVHMIFGILGPLLIIFHSTFRIGSMNARVAMYSMLAVTASGIIGRFVYRQVHRGLYNQRITLAELNEELKKCSEDLNNVLDEESGSSNILKEFHEYCGRHTDKLSARVWHFLTLRYVARTAAKRAYLKAELALMSRTESLALPGWKSRMSLLRQRLKDYMAAECAAAQFTVWESLFSLWHVIHIPLVYLLAASALAHVVAVHMY